MRIVFMGTPLFALPTLKAITETHHDIVGVFTQAPKAKGRGMSITKSPIHEFAEQHNYAIFTPSTIKSDEIFYTMESINPDVIIVAAYGFIIPKRILELPQYGCLNIHPSLLPRYRGAAPLQHTILNGDSETAVCIMQMDQGMDTGDIIAMEKFSIDPKIQLQALHDHCSNLGAKIMIDVLQTLELDGKVARTTQDVDGATHAYKLQKEHGLVDWRESAHKIDCMVRSLSPWPGVYFTIQSSNFQTTVKILDATPVQSQNITVDAFLNINDLTYSDLKVGSILDRKKCIIKCGNDTYIQLNTVQPESKKAMSGSDMLNGLPKAYIQQ